MKTTTALYKALLSTPGVVLETQVKIGSTVYGTDRIVSCELSGGIFSDGEIGIGGCVEGQIDISLREQSANIPRMAQIVPEVRLASPDGRVTEWEPAGVYFVDTRAEDYEGEITLSGFDAMLKSEAVWWDPSQDAGEWPMKQTAAVADIARRMGVAVDSRTAIDPTLMVDYPNDATMREILEEIAVANCGNWCMTGEGKLFLAPLGLPPETSLLVDGADGGAILMGEVRLIV